MKNFWKEHGPSLVLLGGAALVAAGAGMIYLPAGVITAGVLAIAWWVLDSIGGDGEGGGDGA